MDKTGSWKTGDPDILGVNQANVACAHLTVKWKCWDYQGGTKGCWRCVDCETAFCLSAMAEIYEKMAHQERAQGADQYKRGFYDGYERRHKEVLGALI